MFFEETNLFNSEFNPLKYGTVRDAILEQESERAFEERAEFEYYSNKFFATQD